MSRCSHQPSPNQFFQPACQALSQGPLLPLGPSLSSKTNGTANCERPPPRSFDCPRLRAPSPRTAHTLPRRPKDVNGLDTQPRTFSEFTIPNAQPYLIGTFCRQYVWQDTAANQAGAKYYARGWRSENETWVFLRNACDCPGPPDIVARACLPQTAGGCNDGTHGPPLMRADEGCLQNLGISPSACPTRLVGVSGGAVVFAVGGEAKVRRRARAARGCCARGLREGGCHR